MDSEITWGVVRTVPVDIEFEKLSFCIGKKEILKSVSGNFSSGSLSAILGSSGAGKTTLLNILAGHVQSGVSGQVLINGKRRVMQTFHKMSCYLMQEDLLRPLLSVKEAISISAKLKLGKEFSSNDKERAVRDVMNLMGLEKCSNTRVENLSGGQKKRLSIALEMVNNPPVVFLDEPTTGLDNVVAKKFIKFLKALASHGRTIVCTIHQPSDLMFQLFDQAYFLSDGYCVYNGEADGIVPFLSSINLPCPSTYSPCDYKTHNLSLCVDDGKALRGSEALVLKDFTQEHFEEHIFAERLVQYSIAKS